MVSPRLIGRPFDLFLSLDRSRGKALSRQIEDQLRTAIRSCKLQPGRALPSTRALAEDISVSRGVIVRAYAQLSAEGYLDVRRGAPPSVRSLQSDMQRPKPPRAATPPAQAAKSRYDLRPHVPDTGFFPRHPWLRSLAHAVTTAGNADLNYGDPRGIEHVRAEVSAYLGRARGIAADPDQIIITAGCTHSLNLVFRMLSRRGAHRVALENPSHSQLAAVARAAGLSPVGISLDGDGILVGELKASAAAAVVISAGHQFPFGSLLSRRRQAALNHWAATTGALIIEDEYDAGLRTDWTPISARDDLNGASVIYLGSTGKTLAPAVRLGWAVLPKALAPAFAEEVSNSVLQIPAIDQLAFADFLRRGEFDRHLQRLRVRYGRRRENFAASFEAGFPDAELRNPAAGLSMLISLPSVELERVVREHMASRGIRVETISEHMLPGYRGPAGLLLGVGGLPDGAIADVVEELGQALVETGALLAAAA